MTIINLHSGEMISLDNLYGISCAIGSFDGVHMGHIELLKAAASKKDDNTCSAVFTFNENPHFALNNKNVGVITSNVQKNNI